MKLVILLLILFIISLTIFCAWFLLRKKTNAKKPASLRNLDYPVDNWMSKLPDKWKSDVKLLDWIVPGAHDALTAGDPHLINPSLPSLPVQCFCSTQTDNTVQLIQKGCRFFDISSGT